MYVYIYIHVYIYIYFIYFFINKKFYISNIYEHSVSVYYTVYTRIHP